jgi:hypothetical protein
MENPAFEFGFDGYRYAQPILRNTDSTTEHPVGWVERSDTHRLFSESAQPETLWYRRENVLTACFWLALGVGNTSRIWYMAGAPPLERDHTP